MRLDAYTETLRRTLVEISSLGDDRTQDVARSLAAALDPALRLVALQMLTDTADDLNAELDRAQVTGEMAARLTDGIQQKFAQFGGDLRQLFFLQTAQILRRIDNIEQRAWVHDFWR